MPIPANPCDNCSAPVAVRRPSASGKHFCKRSKCQTAKQRFYRERGNLDTQALIGKLVSDLAAGRRVYCDKCGLKNALPGWGHRNGPNSLTPCYGVGSLGAGLPKGMLDSIHPELAPR